MILAKTTKLHNFFYQDILTPTEPWFWPPIIKQEEDEDDQNEEVTEEINFEVSEYEITISILRIYLTINYFLHNFSLSNNSKY